MIKLYRKVRQTDLKILLYLFFLSLAACHPKRTMLNELNVAESLVEEEPDTALYILQNIIVPEELAEEDYAMYCLLRTQAEEGKRIPLTSDAMIRYAAEYFDADKEPVLKAKAYYYWGRANEDMKKDFLATECYLVSLTITEKAKEYKMSGKIYDRLGILYKKLHLYDKAFEAQRKSYANYLLAEQKKTDSPAPYIVFVISGIVVLTVVFYPFHRRKKLQKELSEANRSVESLKEVNTNQRIELTGLRKDLLSLKKRFYENSDVITKLRKMNNGTNLKEKPSLNESEWNKLLSLMEETFGFIKKLKDSAPRLTEDDIRICALLKEGLKTSLIAVLMGMTPETLSRRMLRIKSDKLGRGEWKGSLETMLKSF